MVCKCRLSIFCFIHNTLIQICMQLLPAIYPCAQKIQRSLSFFPNPRQPEVSLELYFITEIQMIVKSSILRLLLSPPETKVGLACVCRNLP